MYECPECGCEDIFFDGINYVCPDYGYTWNYIMGDLSPIASYITYNYCNRKDSKIYIDPATNIFEQLEKELGYSFEFKDSDGIKAQVNYIIRSEEQVCPECGEKFVHWDAAVV